MTVKNFEAHVDEVMLDRGLAYFEEENVDNFQKVAAGRWTAQVFGSETYDVEVRTNRTQIKAWACTCPYNHGPICKHVVAVLYTIANALQVNTKNSKSTGAKKKSIRKDKVAEILKKTDKKELEAFILSQFRAFGGLKNAFIAYFSELLDENPETKYRTLVRNIYKAAKGRYGYIDYMGTKKLVNPLFQLIEKAQRLLTEKNQTEALVITKTILEEVPVMMLHLDDSNGYTGSLIKDAFNLLYEIAQKAPPMVKDGLFEYCCTEYPKKKYRDFGFENDFLYLLPQLATLKEQSEKFLALLDAQIEEAKGDRYSEYRSVALIKTKIEYLTKAKKYEAADALIAKNKEYPDFRRILIDKALEQKNFQEAKNLCHDGAAIAKNKRFAGHVRIWQDELLRIAENENNVDDIRVHAVKLYFDNWYDMKYYRKLKNTYSESEWINVFEGLVKKIQGPERRRGYEKVIALADIFVEEKQWSRLLEQLQLPHGSLSLLNTYASNVTAEYPTEILDCYEIAVKENAKNTGRSVYNETARYLKKIQTMEGGKERVSDMLDFFRATYKNRPAMLQVLEKKYPILTP